MLVFENVINISQFGPIKSRDLEIISFTSLGSVFGSSISIPIILPDLLTSMKLSFPSGIVFTIFSLLNLTYIAPDSLSKLTETKSFHACEAAVTKASNDISGKPGLLLNSGWNCTPR